MKPKYRNIHTGKVVTRLSVEDLPPESVARTPNGEEPLSRWVCVLSDGSRWNHSLFHQHWELMHPFYNLPFQPRINGLNSGGVSRPDER